MCKVEWQVFLFSKRLNSAILIFIVFWDLTQLFFWGGGEKSRNQQGRTPYTTLTDKL